MLLYPTRVREEIRNKRLSSAATFSDWHWANNFRILNENFSAWLLKLHSTCRDIWEKIHFLRKFFFRTLSEKFSRLQKKIFRRDCQKSIIQFSCNETFASYKICSEIHVVKLLKISTNIARIFHQSEISWQYISNLVSLGDISNRVPNMS